MKNKNLLIYQIATTTAGILMALITVIGALFHASWATTTGFITVAIWAFILITAIPVVVSLDKEKSVIEEMEEKQGS